MHKLAISLDQVWGKVTLLKLFASMCNDDRYDRKPPRNQQIVSTSQVPEQIH
jgi:hypothetical protein